MACSFSIPISGPIEGVIIKAKAAIESQGGNFSGNLTSGTFSVQVMGSIAGSYHVTGQFMNVRIDSKPIFITCGQIENFMKNQFG